LEAEQAAAHGEELVVETAHAAPCGGTRVGKVTPFPEQQMLQDPSEVIVPVQLPEQKPCDSAVRVASVLPIVSCMSPWSFSKRFKDTAVAETSPYSGLDGLVEVTVVKFRPPLFT
jgi:hypothetical protein